MRVCVEFDPLTDPLTAGHGRNRETRTDRDRPVSFPLRPSASTRFTLPTVRNQQVSGSSPLAGSNLALIKQAASDPVLMVAIVFLSSISAIIFLRALVIRGLVTQSVRRVTIRNPSF